MHDAWEVPNSHLLAPLLLRRVGEDLGSGRILGDLEGLLNSALPEGSAEPEYIGEQPPDRVPYMHIINKAIGLRWTCQKFSTPLSDSDRPAKSFPRLYRIPIDPPKVFHASIDARWTCQKFSMPLSMPDRPAKSFPRLYRCPMDVPKVFHAAIGLRQTRLKFSTPLSESDGVSCFPEKTSAAHRWRLMSFFAIGSCFFCKKFYGKGP